MIKTFSLAAILLFVGLFPFVFAQDGQYDATVSIASGDYKAVVYIENNEIVRVRGKNGEDVEVYGAKIVDGEADGTDSKGHQVHIEIDNYNSFQEVFESPGQSTNSLIENDQWTFHQGATRDVE